MAILTAMKTGNKIIKPTIETATSKSLFAFNVFMLRAGSSDLFIPVNY
jgi:hypothetical protein